MNGHTSWFAQLAGDRLAESLPIFAARFLIGKLERWSKLYLVAQFAILGVLCGWVAMTLCIAMGLSLHLIIGFALIGTLYTIALPVGWLIVNHKMPEVEAGLAGWLSSQGRRAFEAF